MIPYLSILGHTVSTYGVMIVVGALIAFWYLKRSERKRKFPNADAELAVIYGMIGAFLGSKILYLLTVFPRFRSDLPVLFRDPGSFLTAYLNGGFVFYGGYYGMLASAAIYCKITKLDFGELSRILAPLVPLFHVFGRIGCFLTGCCYGIEHAGLGIAFTVSELAPNGVPLLPVQLYEAAGEAILFVWTARKADRAKSGKAALSFWMIGYGILRFFLEFLRGDAYRGFLGPLSTSQAIALFSVLFGAALSLVSPDDRIAWN